MDISKLREEFAQVHQEATALNEASATRDLTEEETNKQVEAFAKLDKMQKQIENAEKLARFSFSTGAVQKPEKSVAQIAFEDSKPAVPAMKGGQIDREAFSDALNSWAATGHVAEQFATTTTTTASGFIMPKSVVEPLIPVAGNVYRDALALYGKKAFYTATTANVSIPVFDAAAGGVVSETSTTVSDAPPGFTESMSPVVATYQGGTAYYSNLALGANNIDLLNMTVPALVESKELGLEAAITAAIIADDAALQDVTTATTTGFTYGNLVSLNRKLAKKYDKNKVILLSDTAYAYAEALVGSDGHPVLNRDPMNAELLRFNGTPVLRAGTWEAMTAGKIIGAVISLNGFVLRDAASPKLTRYENDKDKPDQTGINLFDYHGFDWAPSAIALFKTAAS